MLVTAIILAAGRGERLGVSIPKPLVSLGGRPLILYSLDRFVAHPLFSDIVVAVNAENQQRIGRLIERQKYTKRVRLVRGGKRRQDSVRNALKVLSADAGCLIIHDAARPLLDQGMISAVIKALRVHQAVITGVPVKATIKRLEGRRKREDGRKILRVKETLKRDELVEVQTPQGFRRDILLRAYRRYGRQTVTDDAGLIEKLGVPVGVVMGSYANIKVTTPEDLVIAEALLESKKLKEKSKKEKWTIA